MTWWIDPTTLNLEAQETYHVGVVVDAAGNRRVYVSGELAP